jgi:hypothetical protein
MLTKGNLKQGVKIAEDISTVFFENGSIWHHVTTEYMLGNLYLQIVIGGGPKTFTFLAKNIAFLIKSFPRASEKAEYHLNKTIETAKEIGAKLSRRIGDVQRIGDVHKNITFYYLVFVVNSMYATQSPNRCPRCTAPYYCSRNRAQTDIFR